MTDGILVRWHGSLMTRPRTCTNQPGLVWPDSRRSAAPAHIKESKPMSVADTAMPVTLPTAPLTAPPPPTAPLPPAAQPPTAQPPAIARPPAGAPSVTPLPPVPVSATLAANETLARKRRDGETVLPLAFGEAGLPTHPLLRDALAA